jgi:hypothetical protein
MGTKATGVTIEQVAEVTLQEESRASKHWSDNTTQYLLSVNYSLSDQVVTFTVDDSV